MSENNKEKKVCFAVTEEQHKKVKELPRSCNLSEELRNALDKILAKYDTGKVIK